MADMGKQVSLERLAKYTEEVTTKISQARREVEEVQLGFNSAYVEWKAQHDATLERLVESALGKLAEVGPELQGRVEQRAVEERKAIAERRQELEELFIPDLQEQADKALAAGQQVVAQLRSANPQFDQREEELKAQRTKLEAELEQLNQQIRRLSGCFVAVFNFLRISKLDRKRQRVIGQLQQIQQEIRKVRQQWDQVQRDSGAEQAKLEQQWQKLTLDLAGLQGERDYLAEEANREELALKRAVRHVIDNLKEPIPCRIPEIKAELDKMVELNSRTDDYEAGLASVVSVLALLDGVTEGMKRFGESVAGLIEEQRMHSAYLPQLEVVVPDQVLAFHSQWDGLAQKVRDEVGLAQHPSEFVRAVQPTIERDLSEASIKAMFEGLGQALKQATSSWRG